MHASSSYDGIILGSGHNSLVLQAYLCDAGLDVVCLEARHEIGGGLTTVEDPNHPGFLHNTHSFFHRALDAQPWYDDLNLAELGAEYIEPALNAALITEDGRALKWWTDIDRTVTSFAEFSERDAARVEYWHDRFEPIVEDIIIPEQRAPPLPPDRRAKLLAESEHGQTLLEVSELSPLQFVKQEFDHPVVQAGLLFFNGLREVDLRVEGFGHHIPMLLSSPAKAQMAKGGSFQLARALRRSIEGNVGSIRVSTRPERIVVEDGEAVGVETTDGEVIEAREFVASGLNPHQTFLELLGKSAISGELREQVEDFEYNLLAPLFAVNLDLDEPPSYEAVADDPDLEDAFMVILGLDAADDYLQMVEDHQSGSVPPTIMWGCSPTKFDPSQAPEDKHTAFMWEKMPYHLDGEATNWDAYRSEHEQVMLDQWESYAPDLREHIISSFARSPLDTERTFPNMRDGDLLVGSFDHGQLGYHRPFPGAGHYRAPEIEGLYLCGASSHPGGNITGLVGYNCAQVLFADLDLPAPWAPEPVADRLEALA